MKKQRSAVAMIELVFSLIIIAIVLTAIPRLVTVSNRSSYLSSDQEAISQAVAYMNIILSQHWDENGTNSSYPDPVLVVENGDRDLDEAVDNNGIRLGRREGTPKMSHRLFVSIIPGLPRLSATPSAYFGSGKENDSLPDDIDDFHGLSRKLKNVENSGREKGEYIDTQIEMTPHISYINDTPDNGIFGQKGNYNKNSIRFDQPFADSKSKNKSSNIKKITLILKTRNRHRNIQKQIILNAFSCNIGSTALEERKF